MGGGGGGGGGSLSPRLFPPPVFRRESLGPRLGGGGGGAEVWYCRENTWWLKCGLVGRTLGGGGTPILGDLLWGREADFMDVGGMLHKSVCVCVWGGGGGGGGGGCACR